MSAATVTLIAKIVHTLKNGAVARTSKLQNAAQNMKISERIRRKVVRLALETRTKPAREIRKELNDVHVKIL